MVGNHPGNIGDRGMPLIDLDNPKLSFHQKRLMDIQGFVSVGEYFREGWKSPIKHYAFRCKRHGIVVDYAHGYWDILKNTVLIPLDNGVISQLICPKCLEEKRL